MESLESPALTTEHFKSTISTTSNSISHDPFAHIRERVIGYHQLFESPFGMQRLIYADWTASGRLYGPIEDKLHHAFGPFVANTHTETTVSGTAMTLAYHHAQQIIKRHVNAGQGDVLIATGSGMTGALAKLHRILGVRVPEQLRSFLHLPDEVRPVVFVTHMEHHSNQTSWLETLCTVEIIRATNKGLVDVEHLKELLHQYRHRQTKIASITSCSNVTGVFTPYYEIARVMHEHGGWCFVDFACSAPYIDINMHPDNPLERLDAIFFSPHKFLGGPGSAGILVFNAELYKLKVPEQPGGGTVKWTNPWGEHAYYEDIEIREDGGTPAFLQTIKAALAIQLKEQMGVTQMLNREHAIMERLFSAFRRIPRVRILADHLDQRLGVLSFYIEGLHYNLGVKLLNDRFGIQTRGGCSCAGTYGHYLLNVDPDYSHSITAQIDAGNLSTKPGWIRLSIHPVMTDEEIDTCIEAVEQIATHYPQWQTDYTYSETTNEFTHAQWRTPIPAMVERWFMLDDMKP
jgi:selenocysteine lyase/cysteine desulfurase